MQCISLQSQQFFMGYFGIRWAFINALAKFVLYMRGNYYFLASFEILTAPLYSATPSNNLAIKRVTIDVLGCYLIQMLYTDVIYTVNHKKGGSTFVIITLENLDGF